MSKQARHISRLPKEATELSSVQPDLMTDYPPNLSILISGGKENNSVTLSNGE